jgi:hypothetical protein
MSSMYVKNHFSPQQFGAIQCTVKLSMPTCNAAKAKTGIRTHVFDTEENTGNKR